MKRTICSFLFSRLIIILQLLIPPAFNQPKSFQLIPNQAISPITLFSIMFRRKGRPLIYISERLQLRTAYQLMNRLFRLYPLTRATYRNSLTLELGGSFSKFMKKKQNFKDYKKQYVPKDKNEASTIRDQESYKKKKNNKTQPPKANDEQYQQPTEIEDRNSILNDDDKISEGRVAASSPKANLPKEYALLFNDAWVRKTHQVLMKEGFYIVDQLIKISRLDSQEKERKMFNFLRHLIPKLSAHKIELPYESFETCFRKVFFYANLRYIGSYAEMDYQTIVFFNNNASRICQIIQKHDKIEEILTFYNYFMQLFNNRTHMTVTKANLNEIISSLFSKIALWCDLNNLADPHALAILKMFSEIVTNKKVREEQLRFINSLCSQVPFLDLISFKVFMLHLTKFFVYTDEGITRSVLELIKMDHLEIISGLKQHQYLPFVQGLRSIVNDRPQIVHYIEEIYEMLLKQIFKQIGKQGNIKYSMNIVGQFLVQLSNRLNFSKIDKKLIYNLFLYFKSTISIDLKDPKMIALNFNRLFELLKIMVINNSLDPIYFNSQLRMLEKAANSLVSKYSNLKKSYLLSFLKNPSKIYAQQLPISFKNAQYVEQSSSIILKFLDKYLKEENIPAITQIFMLMLNRDNECSFSKIRRNEGQLQMEDVLHRINAVLVKTGKLDTYKEIFFSILQIYEESSKFILVLIDSLNKIPKIDKAEVLNCYFQASLRKSRLMVSLYKSVINNQLLVIEHYFTLGYQDLLLQVPNFFNIVGRMIHYLSKTMYFNETSVNIYKLVQFILENEQNGKIMNSIFYGHIKNFAISEEAAKNLSKYINVNELQGYLLRYKINTLLQSEDLNHTYDLVFLKKTVQVSETNKLVLQKRFFKDFKYDVEPTPQNLFLFFYEKDMETLFSKNQAAMIQMLKNFSQAELAKCLYRFYTDDKTIKTVYFKTLWSQFLSKLQRPDLYLSIHILIKMQTLKIQRSQLNRYLMFLLSFFSQRFDRLPSYHIKKLPKYIIDIVGDQEYNIQIKHFFQSLRNYVFKNQFYLPANEKYEMMKYALMAGQRISYEEMCTIKNFLYEDPNCYLIIYNHEETLASDDMDALLKDYRMYRRRNLTMMKKVEMSEFEFYNESKYPQIFTPNIPDSQTLKSFENFNLTQYHNRSVETLKRFVNKYDGVTFNEKYRVAITKNHAIAFCQFSYKLYYDFLVKLFNMLPETKNLQIIICNSEEKVEKIEAFLEERDILIPNQTTKRQRQLQEDNSFINQEQ